MEAVAAAMNNQRPIVCIQGPPGTGKSHVLAEIILQANKKKQKVLICAPTHQAVDNLMSRVQKYVENVYNAAESGGESSTKTIRGAMESHSDFDLLAQLYEEICTLKKTTRSVDELQKIGAKAEELRKKIRNAVVSSSNIIFTTLSSNSVKTLRYFGFIPDFVVIEEAGQALECASWVALLQVDY